MSLLEFNDRGIYCQIADVYIDPWKPVKRAIITHGHSDHARNGHQHYLCHTLSKPILHHRLGSNLDIQAVPWGEKINHNGVAFSLHPAGHIIGSSQIRVEYKDEVWVVTGDYKLEDDQLSGVYEPIPCHHFITECTFGLPIYTWKPQADIYEEINQWWSQNASDKKTSVLAAYSLGKAQRLLQGLNMDIGPVYTHGAIENTNAVIRSAGVELNATEPVGTELDPKKYQGGLVLAPPGALGSAWMKRFKSISTGVASGWMAVRGNRRRRGVDRGFVLSDHVDWPDLNRAVAASDPDHVYATHGFRESTAKWFNQQGRSASTVDTLYEGEVEDKSSEQS